MGKEDKEISHDECDERRIPRAFWELGRKPNSFPRAGEALERVRIYWIPRNKTFQTEEMTCTWPLRYEGVWCTQGTICYLVEMALQ